MVQRHDPSACALSLPPCAWHIAVQNYVTDRRLPGVSRSRGLASEPQALRFCFAKTKASTKKYLLVCIPEIPRNKLESPFLLQEKFPILSQSLPSENWQMGGAVVSPWLGQKAGVTEVLTAVSRRKEGSIGLLVLPKSHRKTGLLILKDRDVGHGRLFLSCPKTPGKG